MLYSPVDSALPVRKSEKQALKDQEGDPSQSPPRVIRGEATERDAP